VNDVEQQLGPVDILINNAGVVAPLVPTAHLRPVDIEQAMRPKFLAPVIVSAAVLAGMRDRGWGRIVDVSSGAVRRSTHQTSHDEHDGRDFGRRDICRGDPQRTTPACAAIPPSRALIKPGGQCARWPLRWRTRPMTSSGMSLPMAPLE
jgi:NAD(P)-dependent dehydrogenase (short-subunit alcohol dehydrogenase family)